MKKRYLIVFYLILFVISTNVVKAKEVFSFGWDNGASAIISNNSPGENIDYSIRDNNIEYKDGYVTTKLTFLSTKSENIVPENSDKSGVDSYYETNIYYYDLNGNVIKNKTYKNILILSINSYGDYLYALVIEETSDGGICLLKLDESLSIVKKLYITDLVIDTESSSDSSNNDLLYFFLINYISKMVGYNTISIVDGKIVIFSGINGFISTDTSLKSAGIIEFGDSEEEAEKFIKTYFYEYYLTIMSILGQSSNTANVRESVLITFDSEGKRVAGSGLITNVNDKLNLNHGLVIPHKITNDQDEVIGYEYAELDAKLGLFNQDNKLIWEKINNDYFAFLDTKIINNYIVTIGINLDLPKELYETSNNTEPIMGKTVNSENISNYIKLNSDILIYDMSGNLVQTISNGGFYLGLFETDRGFITTNVKDILDLLKKTVVHSFSNDNNFSLGKIDFGTSFSNYGSLTSYDWVNVFGGTPNVDSPDMTIKTTMTNEVWHFKNSIKTTINGNGTISVVDSSLAGDKVSFIAIPKDGYVLSSVKVIDAEGNVLTFTDNTFTMPSADVTIEAVFVKNPNTSDTLILVASLVIIISFIYLLSTNKKMKFMN